jgi:rubrerythrin
MTREEMINGLYDIKNWKCDGDAEMHEVIVEAIEALSAKPQKMGRWLAVENEDMETVGYYCSECDLPMETEEQTSFCPNCGAKMEVRNK